jgi:uncharacterized protein (DUF934 family)
MLLASNGSFTTDRWRHLADDEALPEDRTLAVTVTAARFDRERDTLLARPGGLGLRLPNDRDIETIAGELTRFGLILLHFPRFTDGRAYSQASLLRGRHGYRGEIRAAGNVLRDQLLFMRRCGIDAFEVGERAGAENWAKAFKEFDIFYQPAADGRPWLQRRLRPAAE